MGGTALVFTGLSVGIILSVSRGEKDETWAEKGKGSELENRNVEMKAA
jgi:cell division protein FtsW